MTSVTSGVMPKMDEETPFKGIFETLSMRKLFLTTCALVTEILATQASSDVIQVSNSNDSFLLYSHSIDGIFDTVSPSFSTSDLASLQSTLNNWGIDTDGKITILPVDTSAGLSFITLIDAESGFGDTGFDGMLGLTSTAPNTASMFMNDSEQDTWTLIQPPFGSQTLGAIFVWGSLESGDGFAWAGLALGDALSFNFNDLDGDGGAIEAEAFQFVGWNNGEWDVIASNGFKTDGTSVFTGMVVPAPPAALLLAALSLNCRRRRR
jgi:hypothetical protein